MPRATDTSITIPPAPPTRSDRRTFIGHTFCTIAALGAAGVLYSRAEPATVHPDAELIAIGQEAAALIDQYHAIYTRFFALPSGHPDQEVIAAEGDGPSERIAELLTRANELKATTAAGVRAKAVLLREEFFWQRASRGVLDPKGLDEGELLAWGLINDLVALEVAA